MMSKFARIILKLLGWKIEGDVPYHIPKKLYVVIPHTSNWDFPIGILLKMAKKMEVGFIAKDSLFVWPFGLIFRAMGGIPVNRSKSQGFIKNIVDTIHKRDRFSIAITPEGTRKKVSKLKSGYYRISKAASIPIVYTTFDWGNKILKLDKPRTVANTWEEEANYATKLFAGVKGKIPEYSFGIDQ